MADRRDPLEDGPPDHDCDHGWVHVHPEYAERTARTLVPEGVEPPAAMVAALADSWYPCKWCQPTQFFRWAQGHWHPEHDITACAECIAVHGGRRHAGMHAAVGRDRETGHAPTRPAQPPLPTEPPPDLYDDEPRRDLA